MNFCEILTTIVLPILVVTVTYHSMHPFFIGKKTFYWALQPFSIGVLLPNTFALWVICDQSFLEAAIRSFRLYFVIIIGVLFVKSIIVRVKRGEGKN